MSKILKIEDVIFTTEDGKDIAKYIFNDDKIVRVNIKDDRVLTKGVSQIYLDLISISSLKNHNKQQKKNNEEAILKKKADDIMSGRGAGLGIFLGLLTKATIIGPVFVVPYCFKFLKNICNDKYLINTDAKDLNFRKGYFATASYFGIIVMVSCCLQWKKDMLSVLDGCPNKYSENGHICFKVWTVVSVWIDIISIFLSISSNNSNKVKTRNQLYSNYR